MKEMVALPGVARKTANIVLSHAYGVIEGIAVDTHVRRVSERLNLTANNNPDKIERDLMKIIPRDKWMRFTDLLIFHGRRICAARNPKCGCVPSPTSVPPPSRSTNDTHTRVESSIFPSTSRRGKMPLENPLDLFWLL